MKLRNKLKNRILRSIRLAALTGAMTMFSAAAFAAVANDALPTNGKFMGSSNGTIMSANGVMTVDQNTAAAAVKWDTFNVGANATINFNYKGAQSGNYSILNYSTNGNAASEIYGRMKAGANANVWLVNPYGVTIGKGAQIDVGHMHMVAHKLSDTDLIDYAYGTINNPTTRGEHTSAELMSMGNLYVNSISFDGNRVVLDADKLFTYAGEKVELGQKGALGTDGLVHNVTAAEIEAINNRTDLTAEQKRTQINTLINGKATVGQVFIGENGMMSAVTGSGSVSNNTGSFASAADSKWSGDTIYAGNYLTVGHHARELVVGYTAYDEDQKAAHGDGSKGTYENSANWRALYTTLVDHKDTSGNLVMRTNSERVGFAWVEDSTQLERIGEGEKVLSRDFALKDGIAAVNTKEMNGGKGFNPIGDDLNNPDPSDPNHHGVAFTGKFDGLNYDIYGLTINRPDTNDVGMFGYVGDGAVIRNVSLVSGAIVGNNNVGGVIGYAKVDVVNGSGVVTSTGTKGITIENVKNSARILGVENVGGIIGKAEGNTSVNVKVINAENVAFVRGNVNVGGIVGDMTHTAVTGETFNTGAVKGIVNYKDATTGYEIKSAQELTEKTYELINSTPTNYLAKGTRIHLYKNNGSPENYFVLDYVSRNGNTIKLENVDNDLSNLQVGDILHCTYYTTSQVIEIEKMGASDTDNAFTMRNISGGNTDTEKRRVSLIPGYTVLETEVPSHNVGGIVGTAINSTIGNTGANAFKIYNDVEVEAGYNVGGIIGAGTNVNVNNLINRGDVTALGYTNDYYYYQTAYGTANDMTVDPGWSVTGAGSDSTKMARITITTANAGGIIGKAEGTGTIGTDGKRTATTNVKDVVNEGNVTSFEKTGTENGEDFQYNLAANVGGVIGYAKGGSFEGTNSSDTKIIDTATTSYGIVVDNASNKENKIAGAANVGGIVGNTINTKIINSVNDGGEITITGARKGNDAGFAYEAIRSTSVQHSFFVPYLIGNAGGVVGMMQGQQSYLDNVRNRGYIHTPAQTTTDMLVTNTASSVGGIAGKVINRNYAGKTLAFAKDSSNNVIGFDNKKLADSSSSDNPSTTSVANVEDVAVKNAANTGTVEGYSSVGGVVGQMFNGEIMDSYNLGNVKVSVKASSFNDQSNLGGILGDNPAKSQSFVRIYNVYNSGIIGDPNFNSYGRHMGGIVGRLRGYVEKSYNTGDIFNGTDNTGGIVGYLQLGKVHNVFNTGNITNYDFYMRPLDKGMATKVGGIVGDLPGQHIENAYNIGIIRSILADGVVESQSVGGISGTAGDGSSIKNVYSTGEILTGKYEGTNFIKTNGEAHAIAPGNIVSYGYFILPEDYTGAASDYSTSYSGKFSRVNTQYTHGGVGISFKDRYDITKYLGLTIGGTTLSGTTITDKKYANVDPSNTAIFTGSWRMYCYDKVTGNALKYDATGIAGKHYYYGANSISAAGAILVEDANVVATLPILNVYKPNISNYLGGSSKPAGIKGVQYGNEYNPILTFVDMTTPGNTLTLDYPNAHITGRGGVVVENGALTINNVNSSEYFSGTFMAKNGALTINAVNDTLNLASDSRFYGQSVNIDNPNNDINLNGNLESYNGDITVNGRNIEVFGAITSSAVGTTTFNEVEKSAFGKDVDYTGIDILVLNQPVTTVRNKYNSSITTTTNGSIDITANSSVGGSVGIYLGNNKLGKLSTEGNLTVTGQNIYIDSDLMVGVTSRNSTITLIGDNAILDITNVGVTSGESSVATRLNKFADDFRGVGGYNNQIVMKNAAGDSIGSNAKIIADMYVGNDLVLSKYDSTGDPFLTRLNGMHAYNGSGTTEKVEHYTWISNAEQLNAINAVGPAALSMNYALKNSIDASEITTFTSIGTGIGDFTGTFDGRGHNLNSLTPAMKSVTGTESTGLFSAIGDGGAVKNLNINASRLTGETSRVGLVAGTNKGIIENVNTFGNTVKDNIASSGKPVFIGGLVGLNEEMGVIVNSKSEDIVYSDSIKFQVDVGGIAGMNAGILYQVTGKSDVSVADGGATSLGGVAGVNVGYIKDAVSVGVTAGLYDRPGTAGNPDTYLGADNVGGIAGENRTKYLTADNEPLGKATDGNTYEIVSGPNGELTFTIYNGSTYTRTTGANAKQVAVDASEYGGTIADAYNDSHVKGWSNTGGVVGKNFGKGESTTYGGLEMGEAANAYYVANAGDVIAGDNAGGLAGVNNGKIKGTATDVKVNFTDANNNKFVYNITTDGFVSATDKEGHTITTTATLEAAKAAIKAFYTEFIQDKEQALGQTIYGRNSGKIIAKSGMVNAADSSKVTTGTNVGGLIGVSEADADVDHLLNGKAASVYGKVNVGGLIGLNKGILQTSVNLMQNNDIAGAINVGGIVGENSGIIAKIENTNKYNITVNKDYVNLSDGTLKETIVYGGTTYAKGTGHASFFGGILGHNVAKGKGTVNAAAGGIVADVINTANVTIEHPANYVGGVMGKNDGTIGYDGMTYTDKNGTTHTIEGYLRNKGAVGVVNGSNKGDFVGGVIGQNNSAISNVDITNDIDGTVYGYNYVGGIIGQNTAAVTGGRDTGNNYYKYDVYNNGQVTGATNVGGLIGDNASTGSIALAYNTGVVKGTTDVGGIVGSNEGKVDQVFNSTSIYNVEGKTWEQYNADHASETGFVPVVQGVAGTNNVGGLVGVNSGTITNAYNDGTVVGSAAVGNVVGANTGTLKSSYATDTTKTLVGSKGGTIADNYSMYSDDDGATGIKYLAGAATTNPASYTGLEADKWTFYKNASTPLLKNFLTKAYFVPEAGYANAFTYNGKQQGGYVKVEQGHVNVYKISDGNKTNEKLGEIFAADVKGDHSLKDYLMTKDANGNGTLGEALDGQQLIIGKADGIDADNYSLLYSQQINTYYNQDVRNAVGVKERVVNPNMLGYEFFEAKLANPSDPKLDRDKPIYDPGIPDYKPDGTVNTAKEQPGAIKPEDTNPKIPTGADFVPTTKAPTYDINKAIIGANGNNVTRTYGNLDLNGTDGYKVTISPAVITDADKAKLQGILGAEYLNNLFKTTTPNLATPEGKLQDGGLITTVPGKVTNNVNVAGDGVPDYKWKGSYELNTAYVAGLSPEKKAAVNDVLKNYVLDTNPKTTAEQEALLALQRNYGNVSLGTGKVEGNSYVTKADLTITLNNFDIVYGDANTAIAHNQTIGSGSTIAVAEKLFTNSALTNGDNDINTIFSITTAKDGAYDGANTKGVGSWTLGAAETNLKPEGLVTDANGVKSGTSVDGNYNVTIINGTVTVKPKQLTITTNDVTREYGSTVVKKDSDSTVVTKDTQYGASISGFINTTEEAALLGMIKKTVTDGAESSVAGRVTNNKNEKGVAGEGGYNWTLNVDLSNPALNNYTLGDSFAERVTSKDTTAKSYVTPKHVTIKLNDVNMMYGAWEGDANSAAIYSEEYQNAKKDGWGTDLVHGVEVATDNVKNLYGFNQDTVLVNGDTLDKVLSVDSSKYVNAGFGTDVYEAGGKSTHETKAVGTYVNGLSLTGGTAAITMKTGAGEYGGNYIIDGVTDGNVKVYHALLEAKGADVYRYYGEMTKYTLGADGKVDKNNPLSAPDYPVLPESITGWAYGDANKTYSGGTKTYGQNAITINPSSGSFVDTAKDGETKTQNVGAYAWSHGTLTKDSAATLSSNYMFWDGIDEYVTDDITKATVGGMSFVLPQIVEVKLNNQTIEYGTPMSDAQTEYKTNPAGIVNNVSGNYRGSGSSLADTVINDIKTNLNNVDATEVFYKDGLAYVGTKTNNVNTYKEAVSLKAGGVKLQENNFDFLTADADFDSTKYTSLKSNANYAIKLVDGDVTITPYVINVGDLSGNIKYGAEGGASAVTGVADTVMKHDGAVITQGVYGEYLGFTQSNITLVADDNHGNFEDVAHGRPTADVGSYANSINRVLNITNPNYILVDSSNSSNRGSSIGINGILNVTPAELVITLNSFNVLYGDTKEKNTIDNNYVRSDKKIRDVEQDFTNVTGLVNTDKDINAIFGLAAGKEVTNEAFVNDNRTKDVNTTGYKLTLAEDATNMTGVTRGTGADANKLYGTSANKNYTITVIDGHVDVLAKKVIVVEPGKDIPQNDPTNPFNPITDNPNEKFDPDAVYVKASDVERTYGSSVVTKGGNVVTVTGLAAWDGGTKNISGYDNDGGLKTTTTTNDARKDYKWDKNIGIGDIAGLGSNYKINGTTTDNVTVKGQSVVNRAKLTIQLKDKLDILYGTLQENIVYDDPDKVDAQTTYSSNAKGLAAQDAGKDWDDLFAYADKNSGYNEDGSGKDAFTNNVQNKYYHNAGNVDGYSQFDITPVGTTGETKAVGVSYDGNYDVTILSGKSTFVKRKLDNHNFAGSDVNRTYGNTAGLVDADGNLIPVDYHATIVGGLAPWDTSKDNKLGVTVSQDIGLYNGNPNADKTNHVGGFTWNGKLDNGKLPAWIVNNYDISTVNTILGASNVDKAKLVVQIGDTSTVYGQKFNEDSYGFTLNGVVPQDDPNDIWSDVNGQKDGYINTQAYEGPQKWTGNAGHHEGALLFGNMTDIDLQNYSVLVLPGNVDISKTTVNVIIPDPNDPSKPNVPVYEDPNNPNHLLVPNDPVNGLPNGDNPNFKVDPSDPYNKIVDPDGNSFGIGNLPNDPNINYIIIPFPKVDEEEILVEDLYPWLHRTNHDHGWGHQEHWRERKAEVKFVIGGADFFNDLAKAEAEDDEKVKES